MSDLTFGEWMLIGVIFYIAWTVSGVISERVTAWINKKRGGGSDAQKKKYNDIGLGDR